MALKVVDSFVIDSSRIGLISVCDQFSDVDKKYPVNKKYELEIEDQSYLVKEIKFTENEIVRVENNGFNGNGIGFIATNSGLFYVANKYHVGSKLNEFPMDEIAVFYEEGEVFFLWKKGNIYCKTKKPLNVGIAEFEKQYDENADSVSHLINWNDKIIEFSIIAICPQK